MYIIIRDAIKKVLNNYFDDGRERPIVQAQTYNITYRHDRWLLYYYCNVQQSELLHKINANSQYSSFVTFRFYKSNHISVTS